MEIVKDAIKLEEELIRLNLEVDTKEDIFEELGKLLIDKGYVKDNYIKALKEREEEFPTGILAVDNIGIAIPHTDAKYVNTSAIAVGVLSKKVSFELMGCDDGLVDVDIVFILAINDKNGHLSVLQKLMNILQKGEILRSIKEAKDSSKVIEILDQELS